jgi:ubiquinone/menaquinone biosynthesis C-methylase UbiE
MHVTEEAERAAKNKRVVRYFAENASSYDKQIRLFERLLFDGGRQWACSRARGDVLEIAVGTGRNLEHYESDVALTGIELSPEMLEIAKTRAAQVGRRADLRLGDAQALEFPDHSFDSVVCTLGLCTIPDDRAAVAEVKRVLRPGGRFLLLEHVRSPLLPIRAAQRVLDPLSVRLGADHLLREPLDHLRALGFGIERVERSRLGIVERVAAIAPRSHIAVVPGGVTAGAAVLSRGLEVILDPGVDDAGVCGRSDGGDWKGAGAASGRRGS